MARPKEYDDETVVCLRATGEYKLQQKTERRAIINLIVDNGGCMRIKDIDEAFGYSTRFKVMALCRGGWLEVRE